MRPAIQAWYVVVAFDDSRPAGNVTIVADEADFHLYHFDDLDDARCYSSARRQLRSVCQRPRAAFLGPSCS
jgi:hypothetical protein